MMDKDEFTRYFSVHRLYSGKKVSSIEMKLSAENINAGEIVITDLQLQEGDQATGTIPNTRDFFNKVYFNIDETHNATSHENIYEGDDPMVFTNMENRFFNVMGRGFETITIPNVFHEDYRVPILTTGLDLTLYPKDDYDFLRISTFYGGHIENQYERTYQDDSLAENPLNYRYTREFCFSGGRTGDEIKILASQQKASVNGNAVPLGIRRFDVGEEITYAGIQPVYYRNRQRFMMLPLGATRVKIEFMKKESKDGLAYMIDDGIGFHGLAQFNQWTWGVSKI